MGQKNRFQSYVTITLCYILAAMIGLWIFSALSLGHWLSLLIADLAATVVIWLASTLLNNASVYDPYWSVQPPIILGLTLVYLGEFNLESVLFVLAVVFWGARLSVNWMITFEGLHEQDWRYDKLEKKSKGFFPLVNLFGIQIMPTLIVYACVLPGFYYLIRGGGLNVWTVIGLLTIVGGASLEMIADYQMQIFRRERKDRACLIRRGVWRHSRHPNYLGEILVWWAVYWVMLSIYPDLWYLGVGSLVNTGLFLFISIPMAEKHLKTYKKDYESYRNETRTLLPIPKRKG